MEIIEWSAQEASTRQALEQRLRQLPGDRHVMLSLASLLASKNETKDAHELVQKASIGAMNDPHAAGVLRKLGSAKLALWRSLRLGARPPYVNVSTERLAHAHEASMFFEDALVYPENADDPSALIESANAKVGAGDLVGALKLFSYVVSNFPAYPSLNAAICRSACLLAYLGDDAQASQYLAYVLDDPPTELGYGEIEIRGLLVCCLAEGQNSSEAGKRLSAALAGSFKRSKILPPDFPSSAPSGTPFEKWGAPWRLLADRALDRCDYVVAVEFLRALLRRDPTPEGWVLLAEALFALGDESKALEAAEAAHGADALCDPANQHLMEWAYDLWAPRLDAAVAAAMEAKARADAEALRRAKAEANGELLHKHVKKQRGRAALDRWLTVYTAHYAATTISRVGRGRLARKVHSTLASNAAFLEANQARVVWNINAHLLRHVLVSWNKYWRAMFVHRKKASLPMVVRMERRLCKLVLAAWHERSVKQILGRFAARKAMKGLQTWGSRGSGIPDAPIIFYSEPLVALASFPHFKKQHEDCVRVVVEEKELMAEVLAASSAAHAPEVLQLPDIGAAVVVPDSGIESLAVSPGGGSQDSRTKKKRRKKKKNPDGAA